jgi:hypothetical protein
MATATSSRRAARIRSDVKCAEDDGGQQGNRGGPLISKWRPIPSLATSPAKSRRKKSVAKACKTTTIVIAVAFRSRCALD